MTPAELRDYKNWHHKSPAQILYYVRRIRGGWLTVFPQRLPMWASRLRNYFNVTPEFLMRYDWEREDAATETHHRNRSGFARFALHGAVYKDRQNRDWLQMSTSALGYHYPGKVTKYKKWETFWSTQSEMKIFKLISPDGSGGSRELIIRNPTATANGDSTVVKVLHWEYIRPRTVHNEYTGSYNYADVITNGFPAHERYDMDTHLDWENFYVDPKDPYSALECRRFPVCDVMGHILADQDLYQRSNKTWSTKERVPDPDLW